MGVTFSGISSGIDSGSIVTQLMALNSRNLNAIQTRKTQWQAKQKAVNDVRSRLKSLQSLVDDMRDANELRSVTSSVSDNTVLIANTSSGAREGAYSIEVNRLATAQRRIHTAGLESAAVTIGSTRSTALSANGVADADAVWFTTTANGAAYSFDFGTESTVTDVAFAADTGYSMNQVAALINARSQAVAGYDAASVELDGGVYKLSLTAEQYGPVGDLTQTLTAGDAVAELNDEADWTKANGAAGAFSYTYDGVTRTLTTAAGTTLEGLRDLINNDGSNPGLVASILRYGGTYHLVLAGTETGGDYGITINDGQTTLAGFASADVAVTQAAQDSQIRIDGYPGGGWIENSGNVLTDLIPNVSITLRSAGTAAVTLNRNTGDLKEKVDNLIGVYNGLVDKVHAYTGYDEETKKAGVLQGDATLRSLLHRIRNAFVQAPAGFDQAWDPYVLASQIGFSFDSDGKLNLVETTLETDTDFRQGFETAISENYLGVLSLIGASGTGGSDNDHIQFTGASNNTTAGAYELEVDFNESGQVSQGRIRAPGEIAWRFMDISGNLLIGAAGNAEDGLQLTATSDGTPGAHTQSATVRARKGLAGAIYDITKGLLDTTTGAMAAKDAQLDSMLEAFDRNIETEQTRLDQQEKRLRAQFARLEATLAQFNAQSAAFQAMFQQLQ